MQGDVSDTLFSLEQKNLVWFLILSEFLLLSDTHTASTNSSLYSKEEAGFDQESTNFSETSSWKNEISITDPISLHIWFCFFVFVGVWGFVFIWVGLVCLFSVLFE